MFFLLSLLSLLLTGQSAAPVQPSLDYDVFKTRVQPIFLSKRSGNARQSDPVCMTHKIPSTIRR